MGRPVVSLTLLVTLLLGLAAPAAARPRGHHLVNDFEDVGTLEQVSASGSKVERERGRLRLGKHLLRWTCAKGAPAAILTLRNVPADVRKFRFLQFHIEAERGMTDPLGIEIRSGEEVLRYEVNLFRYKEKTVTAALPLPDAATENFDPEGVTDIRLFVRKPRKDWELQLDDFVLVEAPGGWRLTVSERIERYFGKKQAPYVRKRETKHFLILSDDSRAVLGKFPREFEKSYDFIREALAAPEFEDPLEVVIFDELIDYQVFCAMMFHSIENAERTAGHATRNYFASSFISSRDPILVHELTHCVFGRAYGTGGGSWIQEGSAEYVEQLHQKKSAAELFAPKLKAGTHVPLAYLIGTPVLAYDKRYDAEVLYAEAGAFFEFLWRGTYGTKGVEAVKTIAKDPQSWPGTKRVKRLEELLGEPLAKIEERWIAWGEKPPKPGR